ncbi:MAG: hypothetical protein KAV87_67505 [Desulfobacteraceae bacterium]|nr:hypothetical protein [Desulfobacteraceae bacterium]
MGQIRIRDEQKSALDKLKDHPRDTYEDVIGKLLKDTDISYDKEFKDWLEDVLVRHHPDFGIMHIQECHAGLQVFCEKNPIILITHDELKMWKIGLYEEGLEPSEKSYSLLEYQILQTIDAKLR